MISDLIKEICSEKGIECDSLSYGWVLKLMKHGVNRFITGNHFDLNTDATSLIINDKYATYEILKKFTIPIIEHKILFNPNTSFCLQTEKDMFHEVLQLFHEYHDDVVIKPNKGTEGNGVFHCTTLADLEKNLSFLFQKHLSVSICPFYNIKTEYRIFYLDGKIEFIYGKVKPLLKGDGFSTVEELLEKFNPHFPQKDIFRENLAKTDLSYVPAKDEEYEFSWKFNLSGGAQVNLEVSNFSKSNIEKIIAQISHALDLKFVTIDIIQDQNDNFWVLEINSGVCLDQFVSLVPHGRVIAKNIYGKAIDLMFPLEKE